MASDSVPLLRFKGQFPSTPANVCGVHFLRGRAGADKDSSREDVTPQHIKVLKERMIDRAWCPHHVNHLAKRYGSKTFYYLATLERSPCRLADHQSCASRTACIAYNADMATYRSRHVVEGCACPMVLTPYQKLLSITRSGGIPLISISGGAGQGTNTASTLRVHRRSRESRYIAISHVWADGVGNPWENGLPQCQIERLRTRLLALKGLLEKTKTGRLEAFDKHAASPSHVDGFGDHILFWMDTLCIPVKSDDHKIRLIQIDQMASVYKGAVTSLVLDSELMVTTLGDSDGRRIRKGYVYHHLDTHARARLACSVWMSRSWTLQEGQLPPCVAIQFQNGVAILGRPSEEDEEYQETIIEYAMNQDRTGPVKSADSHNSDDYRDRNMDDDTSDDTHISFTLNKSCKCAMLNLQTTFCDTFCKEDATELVNLWNELAGRSTTMPDDILVILSNALNLNNRTLFEHHDTGAMLQAILLSLDQLPLSLLFNTGLKQSHNIKNRWVPMSIGPDRLTSDQSLTVRSSYLLYRYLGSRRQVRNLSYTVNVPSAFRSRAFVRFEEEGCIYALEPLRDPADQIDTSEFDLTCLIVESLSLSTHSSGGRGACFMMRKHGQGRFTGALRHLQFWSSTAKLPRFDMIYDCPIRFSQLPENEEVDMTQSLIYTLLPMDFDSEFRIAYDPPPDLQRLPKRRGERSPKAWVTGYVIVIGALHTTLVFTGGLALVRLLPIDETAQIFFLVRVWIFGGVGLYPTVGLWKTYLAWRHTRSFEAIAAARRRRQTA